MKRMMSVFLVHFLSPHPRMGADTEEHESLVQALGLVKDTISQVDSQVHEYETAARLREIASRLEPKPPGRTKDGRAFRREDVARRTLLHEGPLTWKAPSGRQKGEASGARSHSSPGTKQPLCTG